MGEAYVGLSPWQPVRLSSSGQPELSGSITRHRGGELLAGNGCRGGLPCKASPAGCCSVDLAPAPGQRANFKCRRQQASTKENYDLKKSQVTPEEKGVLQQLWKQLPSYRRGIGAFRRRQTPPHTGGKGSAWHFLRCWVALPSCS